MECTKFNCGRVSASIQLGELFDAAQEYSTVYTFKQC